MAGMAVSPRSQLSEGKKPGLQAHEAVSSWTSHFLLIVLSFHIFKQMVVPTSQGRIKGDRFVTALGTEASQNSLI